LIYLPTRPFYIIIINFILVLLKAFIEEDYIIFIIYKFSKVVILITG